VELVDRDRIHVLNEFPVVKGSYVLYWMQQSQRTEDNHALAFAIDLANSHNLPVIVFFGITDSYPDANLRHYSFMLDGLEETEENLKKLSVKLVIWLIEPVEGVRNLAQNAAAVVTDAGYLKIQMLWRRKAAEALKCRFYVIESDIIVPVKKASDKENYSAGTFRPGIKREVGFFLKKVPLIKPAVSSLDIRIKSVEIKERAQIISDLDIDKSILPPVDIKGGAKEAHRKLLRFINKILPDYHIKRNNPGLDFTSGLSPYLHFGQISPLTIALKVIKNETPGAESFLGELIIRRELSINFVFYNKDYDNIRCLPE